jgi:hypothetical protein
MNGPEFFMKYAGYKLLPKDKVAGDPVDDAETLFQISLSLSTGQSLRISSSWWVITPDFLATSFKVQNDTGFRLDLTRQQAIRTALKSGQPCMLLALGKRTLKPRDMFVTYDPRATYLCDAGKSKIYDATQEKDWISS